MLKQSSIGLLMAIIIGVSVSPVFADGADEWCDLGSTICNTDWENRMEIVIDNTKVSGSDDLTNFPILVHISGTDFTDNLDDADDSINDIRFTSAAGVLLDYEIEKYDKVTDNELVAWVEATLDYNDDTTIYMYYDNAETSGYGDEQDAVGTWDDNYVMVHHMNEANSNIIDSTSNDNDSDAVDGSPTYGATGKVGDAIDFDGASGFEVPDDNSLDLTSAVTIQMWVKNTEDSAGTGDYPVILNKGGTESYLMFIWSGANPNNCPGDVQWGMTMRVSTPEKDECTSGTDVTDNAWHMVTGRYDGTNNQIWVDGVQDGTESESGSMTTNTAKVTIGMFNTATALPYEGLIDAIQVSNIARSDGWIATTYNNQNSPSTFYSLAVEEVPITQMDLFTVGDIEFNSGTGNDIVTLYFDDPSNSGSMNVTPVSGTWDYNFKTTSHTGTIFAGSNNYDNPTCDGTECFIDLYMTDDVTDTGVDAEPSAGTTVYVVVSFDVGETTYIDANYEFEYPGSAPVIGTVTPADNGGTVNWTVSDNTDYSAIIVTFDEQSDPFHNVEIELGTSATSVTLPIDADTFTVYEDFELASGTVSLTGGSTYDVYLDGVMIDSFTPDDTFVFGASGDSTILPTIPDTTAPVVTGSTTNITEDGNTELTASDQYTESCTATDETSPANPTCTVQSGSINTSSLGEQTVVYQATDDASNTGTDSITTTVVDTTDPTFDVSGNTEDFETNIEFEGTYTAGTIQNQSDISGIASSVVGGDIVETETSGEYSVTYTVTDNNGNSAVITETVTVGEEEFEPILTILGDNPITILVNSEYIDAGATCEDHTGFLEVDVDGDEIDTTEPGTYYVDYYCENELDEAYDEREVIVTEVITGEDENVDDGGSYIVGNGGTITVSDDISDPLNVNIVSGVSSTLTFEDFLIDEATANESITITGNGAVVVIPSGTTLSGDTWGGVLTLPTTQSVTVDGYDIGVSVQFGDPSGPMSFDDIVTVTLTGETGKVAFVNGNAISQCTDNDIPIFADLDVLSYPKACYVDDGSDLVIYTLSASTFSGGSSSAVTSNGGGDSQAWKTKPTFGLDWNTNRQLVENGVFFNNREYTVGENGDNFHEPFSKQHVFTGARNVVAMKLYAAYDLK
jgi:hypothetical protein